MNGQTHLDQVIVRLMNKTKGYKISPPGASMADIRAGTVLIGDRRVSFEARTLLGDMIAMFLPADFRTVPPETLYQPESRPNLILADESGEIQITLAHLSKQVPDAATVIAHKNEVQQILQRMNSSLEWLPGGIKDVGGRQAFFFEFMMPMLGASVYHLSFFMELDGRLLNGSFVCNAQKLKAWHPFFIQMLESIEFHISHPAVVTPSHPDRSGYHFKEGCYAIHNGKAYQLFPVGVDLYRLISTDPADCDRGFIAKDGCFKKTVSKAEIQAAYQLKLTLIYRGYSFELGGRLKDQVELVASKIDKRLQEELQLEMNSEQKHIKWVEKREIEDVVETRLPVPGFVMPEQNN